MMAEPKTHPTIGSPVTQPVGVAVGSEEVGVGSVGETVGSEVGSPVGSEVGSPVGDFGTVTVSKEVAVVVVPSAVTYLRYDQYFLQHE